MRHAFAQNPDACKLVDPVLADHGKLYRGVTPALCSAMTDLCKMADVLCPNVTESAVLLGLEPDDSPFDRTAGRTDRAASCGVPRARRLVITGARLNADRTATHFWQKRQFVLFPAF